ncbi:dTDP-4-dehydrorhamnose reductase [soil metagenome]
MRFVVLGAKGQLGSDLCPLLGTDVIRLTRSELDLDAPGGAREMLDRHRPDVVINCAAYNLVDRAQTEPEKAFAVNALAVYRLASACQALGSRFVHFSSDYVYGAQADRSQPYREEDAPGPVSVYGASKLAGENLARVGCPSALVIRTCGLYGLHGSGGKGGNFIETMVRMGREGKAIRVVDDQHCTPSYTIDVASAVIDLIGRGATGLFHVTNSGSCSWYELARHAFHTAKMEVSLTPIPSSGYPTPARRPTYSVLALDGLARAGVATPRSWQAAVEAYLAARELRTP